jgi:hypothetical protein
MSTPINFTNNNYLQSILGTTFKNNGGCADSSTSGVSAASAQPPDSSQLSSPLAQLLSKLQQLQQSNPTEYQQVTQQIATNLQTAAQTAAGDGNTTAANQLNQLATDFTNASKTGQLPNISDLAQAVGGAAGHHHHHGHHAPVFQANATQNDALNPMSIITDTLNSAGITS